MAADFLLDNLVVCEDPYGQANMPYFRTGKKIASVNGMFCGSRFKLDYTMVIVM